MSPAAAVSYRLPASVLTDPVHGNGRGVGWGLHGALPTAMNLLAVVARPGQESVELGGLLYAYRRSGARLALLCLTRGEASPLNSSVERLETLRPWELQVAAGLLGVSSIAVVDYPDGRLSARRAAGQLTERVRREVRRQAPDLLLVIDPDDGSPDDVAVAAAAQRAGLPVLARCLQGGRSGWLADLGPHAAAARAAQRSAAAAHASQSDSLAGVQCRLGLLDGEERVRWMSLGHRKMTR